MLNRVFGERVNVLGGFWDGAILVGSCRGSQPMDLSLPCTQDQRIYTKTTTLYTVTFTFTPRQQICFLTVVPTTHLSLLSIVRQTKPICILILREVSVVVVSQHDFSVKFEAVKFPLNEVWN